MKGRVLAGGKYRLLTAIGQGGMGRVYRALHTELQIPIAIKQISLAMTFSPEERSRAISRFLHECHLLAQLSHACIPRVYDYFYEDGACYLVMDFVTGVTLAEVLRREKRLSPPHALRYAIAIAEVLHYLHSQKPPVIFRDLKPANVMITPHDDIRVIDFGIARRFKQGEHTDTGDLGTQGYAPPEQYRGGGQTDERSDLFSLGVILYEMVTGQAPPAYPMACLRADELVPHEISPALNTLIITATQLDRNHRFQSARAFRRALENTLQLEEHRARLRSSGVPNAPRPIPSNDENAHQPPKRTASRGGESSSLDYAPKPAPSSSLTRLCPHCRAINLGSAAHCRICYHPLAAAPAARAPAPSQAIPTTPLPPDPTSVATRQWLHGIWRLFALMLVVVSITGCLLGVYIATRAHLPH